MPFLIMWMFHLQQILISTKTTAFPSARGFIQIILTLVSAQSVGQWVTYGICGLLNRSVPSASLRDLIWNMWPVLFMVNKHTGRMAVVWATQLASVLGIMWWGLKLPE